jgi:hypothetical protein
MIAPTRRTIILYLAGTFVLGAVAGGALGYQWGRQPVFKSFDRDEMRSRFCNRLVSDLGLSPAQRDQLDPILRQNMEEFEAVHRDHYSQIGVTIKRHRERIASIMSPEQKAKYEAMEKERDREREQRMPKRWSSSKGSPEGAKTNQSGPSTAKP